MKKSTILFLFILIEISISNLLNLEDNICYALNNNDSVDSNKIALYHFENQINNVIQDVIGINNGSMLGNAQIIEDVAGNSFRFQYAGSNKMVMDNSGNFGIGTTNPIYAKLEINGAISTGDEGIKWKLFTGTTGSSSITFAHGLDASKIYTVSCSIWDESGGGAQVYGNRVDSNSNFSYRVTYTDTLIEIKNIGGSLIDANDVYKCIVWYVE